MGETKEVLFLDIRHLSAARLQSWGRILPQFPAPGPGSQKLRQTFSPQPQVSRFQCAGPVVLDYVSGMSLLAVFQDSQTEVFYLDRVVALQPGTLFSVFPMGEPCCVELLVNAATPPVPVDTVPLAVLEDRPGGLQLERIYTFLYQECSHNFYFRGEKHDPYELVYVDRGELHTLVRGQDISLGQQQFMLIGRNDWHTQFSDLPVSFLTLSFGAADPQLQTLTNRAFTLTPQLKTVFRKLLSLDRADPYSDDYAQSLLKILLIELLQKSRQESHPQSVPANRSENGILDQALQRISENIHRKLTLEQLAELVHVSVPYLYMLFQAHLGTSPGKYIARIRMEECKVLLRSGELSMGQIAEQMGFSSLQQFSRQFHTLCGMTPTQYVRSLR